MKLPTENWLIGLRVQNRDFRTVWRENKIKMGKKSFFRSDGEEKNGKEIGLFPNRILRILCSFFAGKLFLLFSMRNRARFFIRILFKYIFALIRDPMSYSHTELYCPRNRFKRRIFIFDQTPCCNCHTFFRIKSQVYLKQQSHNSFDIRNFALGNCKYSRIGYGNIALCLWAMHSIVLQQSWIGGKQRKSHFSNGADIQLNLSNFQCSTKWRIILGIYARFSPHTFSFKFFRIDAQYQRKTMHVQMFIFPSEKINRCTYYTQGEPFFFRHPLNDHRSVCPSILPSLIEVEQWFSNRNSGSF